MHLHPALYAGVLNQIVEAVQITAESISPAFEIGLIFLGKLQQSVLPHLCC